MNLFSSKIKWNRTTPKIATPILPKIKKDKIKNIEQNE
jgi:hypothetical protein